MSIVLLAAALVALGTGSAVAAESLPLRLERKIELPDVQSRIDHLRTSLFSADRRRLFLAVRRQGPTPPGIWVYVVPE